MTLAISQGKSSFGRLFFVAAIKSGMVTAMTKIGMTICRYIIVAIPADTSIEKGIPKIIYV
jgi:hypothetical protein